MRMNMHESFNSFVMKAQFFFVFASDKFKNKKALLDYSCSNFVLRTLIFIKIPDLETLKICNGIIIMLIMSNLKKITHLNASFSSSSLFPSRNFNDIIWRNSLNSIMPLEFISTSFTIFLSSFSAEKSIFKRKWDWKMLSISEQTGYEK